MDKKHNPSGFGKETRTNDMDCKKVKQQLSLYAGKDLTAKGHQAVKEHLKSCTSCSNEVETYRSHQKDLTALASDKQDNPVSPFFWQGIQKAILLEENQPVKPPLYRRLSFVSAAAAAVILAVTAYLVIHFSTGAHQTRPSNDMEIAAEKTTIEEELPMPSRVPLYGESDTAPAGTREDKTDIEF